MPSEATDMLTVASVALAVIAVACLIAAGFIFVRSARGAAPSEQTEPSAPPEREEAPKNPVQARTTATPKAVSPDAAAEQNPALVETAPLPPQNGDEDETDSLTVPTEAAAQDAYDKGRFDEAAQIWRMRNNLPAERRALEKADNNLVRLAELDIALGRTQHAAERLRAILKKSPTDESSRLRLIQALLDLEETAEAKSFAEVVVPEDSPLQASLEFLVQAGRAFEAAGELVFARNLYKTASVRGLETGDLSTRLVYLNHLTRLASMEVVEHGPRAEDLERSAFETDPGIESLDEVDTSTFAASEKAGSLSPHKVIVGHLALGGDPRECDYSVRSVASTASRFQYNRLISEGSANSAVFEAVDGLLDYPVAVKISRIDLSEEEFRLLSERLQAVAQLNHPNLTKVSYADHFGSVVRIVSEYNGNGTLPSMINRMEKIGLPLMLRILSQVSSGLANAHRFGLIHGDLRPQNIMIGHDQLIKIVDFALQPWPVRLLISPDVSRSETPARLQDHEVQIDIAHFAELIEYMLRFVVVPDALKEHIKGNDPIEELQDVISKAREGRFSSIAQIQRILLQVLDSVMPGQG